MFGSFSYSGRVWEYMRVLIVFFYGLVRINKLLMIWPSCSWLTNCRCCWRGNAARLCLIVLLPRLQRGSRRDTDCLTTKTPSMDNLSLTLRNAFPNCFHTWWKLKRKFVNEIWPMDNLAFHHMYAPNWCDAFEPQVILSDPFRGAVLWKTGDHGCVVFLLHIDTYHRLRTSNLVWD